MAAKRTMSKKELLQADAVFSFREKVQAFAEENSRQLAAIGLIVCVIAAGIGFWKVRQSTAEKESLGLFYGAMNNMVKSSKSAVDSEIKYSQALEGFKKVSNKYSGTKAGAASLFYAGSCSYSLKKYDEAISYYKEFLDKTGSTLHYLRPFAYESIGYAYEGKGEYRKALEWFEKQKSEGQGVNPMSLLNLARCYEAEGDKEKACQSYREFIEKYPLSSFNEFAQIKTANLCFKD